MTDRIAGVILAGGRSRRMGRPKCQLEVQGTTLLELLVGRFSRHFKEVLVAADPDRLPPGLAARVVPDNFPGRGPLAGIQAALTAAQAPAVLAVACDMPLAAPDMAELLDAEGPDSDVVIPVWQGKLEPLHALYRKSSLPALEESLAGDSWRIRDCFSRLRVKEVGEEQLRRRYVAPEQIFWNLNEPADYLRLREALLRGLELP